MEYLDNIKKIIDRDKILSDGFFEYAKTYLLTIENIKDYLNLFDLQDKNALTVCASGDQTLSLIANGVKKVTCFDINKLTRCLLELKRILILNLEYDEYLSFFDITNKNFLSKYIYNHVSNYLQNDIKEYYDYIFNNFSQMNIFKKFFYGYYKDIEEMKKFITYFEEKKYYYLADKLKDIDITFVHSDIYHIPFWIKEKYDCMLFSNISDYIMNNYDDMLEYRLFIEELKDNLNPNGIIQVGYIYDSDNNNYDKSYFSYKKNRLNHFINDKNNLFITNEFNGYTDCSKDRAITLIKK